LPWRKDFFEFKLWKIGSKQQLWIFADRLQHNLASPTSQDGDDALIERLCCTPSQSLDTSVWHLRKYIIVIRLRNIMFFGKEIFHG